MLTSSNFRKFIDEAKDYLSATFVQGRYELLQNVCSLMTFVRHNINVYFIVYSADDKLGDIQVEFFGFRKASIQSPCSTLLPPKPRPERVNHQENKF